MEWVNQQKGVSLRQRSDRVGVNDMPAACQSRAVTEPQRDSWLPERQTDEVETDRRKSALHFIAERSEAIAITDAETDCI